MLRIDSLFFFYTSHEIEACLTTNKGHGSRYGMPIFMLATRMDSDSLSSFLISAVRSAIHIPLERKSVMQLRRSSLSSRKAVADL